MRFTRYCQHRLTLAFTGLPLICCFLGVFAPNNSGLTQANPAIVTVKAKKLKSSGVTVKATAFSSVASNFAKAKFRKKFLKDLNKERVKRGLKRVKESARYDEIVQKRTVLLKSNFSHYSTKGTFILKKRFDKAGISYKSLAECITMFPWGWATNHKTKKLEQAVNGGSTALVASNTVYEYIYNDAPSKWQHRAILLNPKDKKIGIGAVISKEGKVYSSVGVSY